MLLYRRDRRAAGLVLQEERMPVGRRPLACPAQFIRFAAPVAAGPRLYRNYVNKNIAEGCAEYGNRRRYASYRQEGIAAARPGIAVCPETSRQPIWFFRNQIAPMDKGQGQRTWSMVKDKEGKERAKGGKRPACPSCPFRRAVSYFFRSAPQKNPACPEGVSPPRPRGRPPPARRGGGSRCRPSGSPATWPG